MYVGSFYESTYMYRYMKSSAELKSIYKAPYYCNNYSVHLATVESIPLTSYRYTYVSTR